jgi:hypothetical protein
MDPLALPVLTQLPSYSSIFNLGHRAVKDLSLVPVLVEEKVDGSQFSFGVIDGELMMRSKGATIYADAPPNMFKQAAITAIKLREKLVDGWIYRAEYLSKPKHNCLTYSRVPGDHLVIFDIQMRDQGFLARGPKETEAARLGLECVPLLYAGVVNDFTLLTELMTRVSFLGGTAIEGVVVKPQAYNLFSEDKKVLMGKFVSEAFKEVQKGNWKEANPSSMDICQQLITELRTEARWRKAVQHLRERGLITDSPKDIGILIREVMVDVEREETDFMKERLFKWAWEHIRRGLVAGFPEWYKNQLLMKHFEKEETLG